jgi:Leucine-rich repeat (LRR) protein
MRKHEPEEGALVRAGSGALTARSAGLVRRGLESVLGREPRVLRFPAERAIGTLFIYDHARTLVGDEAEGEWEEAEARGEVTIPAGKAVRLAVHYSVSDLSPFAELQANDLQALYLRDASTAGAVIDDSLRNIQHLTGLLALEISGKQVTDASLVHLRRLTSLNCLSLAWTNITDSGLMLISHLRDLKTLFLTCTQVTDSGLAQIARFTKLESLYLGAVSITSAGLRHIENLRSLRLLYLSETPVTDSGLVHLQGLKELRELSIGPHVTAQGLMALQSLSNLRRLKLWRVHLTNQDRQKLRGALPNCEIWN